MRLSKTIVATLLAAYSGEFSTPSTAEAPLEVQMADNSAPPFASQAHAEAYLSEALPAATAANPKYRTPGTDYDRRWLTKSITFSAADDGGVAMSSDEVFEDYRNGAIASRGTHETRLALGDVEISLETADDLTEHGEKALGILFKCVGAACIHAVWDGKPSLSDRTDIYIQDAGQREKILSAFHALQKGATP